MIARIKAWLARRRDDAYKQAFADLLEQEPDRQRQAWENVQLERSRRVHRSMNIHIDDIVALLERNYG